jgi:hypothetical protein
MGLECAFEFLSHILGSLLGSLLGSESVLHTRTYGSFEIAASERLCDAKNDRSALRFDVRRHLEATLMQGNNARSRWRDTRLATTRPFALRSRISDCRE